MSATRSPDIPKIVEKIWEADAHVALTNYVEDGLIAQGFDLRDLSVLEQFDRVRKTVSQRIAARIADADAKGIAPRFRFSSIDSDLLVFQSGAVGGSARSVAISAVAGLSWRAFEHLCCYILKLGGVTKCHVMRGSKEGGVDVFGILDPSHFLHPAVWKGSRLRVFCQAKKGSVGEPIVRLLNNDLRELSEGRGRAFGLLPEHMKKLNSVVLGGIFSAKGFTKDAETFARNHGLFLVDPDRIVEVLLTSRKDLTGLITAGVLSVNQVNLEAYLKTMTISDE